jgi:hypothetical protein
MQAEWFYTTNQKQMGPISWQELRDLVTIGKLKSHDLVWCEGMAEWVRASDQEGLFPEAAAAFKKSSYADASTGRLRRRDEGDDDAETTPKRKSRARKPEQAGMSSGLKIGLIVGGGTLLLMTLGCCFVSVVVIIVGMSDRPREIGPPPPAPIAPFAADDAPRNYTVMNLRTGGSDERRFTFHEGRTVTITVTNTVQFNNTDVDLHVWRGAVGQDLFANDIRVPPQMNCRVEFFVGATDTYRVQVVNLGPGTANRCVVNIVER